MAKDQSAHNWQRAGFVDGERGRLLWAGEPTLLFVPRKIWILGRELRWAMDGNSRLIRSTDEVLGDFVAITDTPTSGSVLAFARKWGILELCRHDLPPSHKPGCRVKIEGSTGCVRWETWIAYSYMARAVLNVGADLNRGKLGSKDWSFIDPEADPSFKRPSVLSGFSSGIEGARQHFARVFNHMWIRLGSVRPEIWPIADRFKLSIGPADGGLFGVIANQLASTLAGGPGLACCSACSRFYHPKRAVRSDCRNYCRDCGRTAAVRDANRDWRARRKSLTDSTTR